MRRALSLPTSQKTYVLLSAGSHACLQAILQACILVDLSPCAFCSLQVDLYRVAGNHAFNDESGITTQYNRSSSLTCCMHVLCMASLLVPTRKARKCIYAASLPRVSIIFWRFKARSNSTSVFLHASHLDTHAFSQNSC